MPRATLSFLVLALVLDAAIVLVLPVAAVLKRWVLGGMGGRAAGELLVFASVLAVGLAYALKNRDKEEPTG
jgi:NADH:ubiquinone oxidoreductase subunit 3 (subunit A)